jgi:VWFA-related protein
MKTSVLLSLAFGALARGALALVAPTAQEVDSGGVFPARSDAITVDVVVLDREGHPVKGLAREDFVVEEDGAPRPVVAFREVIPESPAETAASEGTTVVTNDSARPERGRTFLVVFDEVHLTLVEAGRARAALDRFLDTSVHAGDHVTLLTTSSGVRRSARLPEGLASLHAWVLARKGLRMPEDPRARISAWEAYRVYVLNDRLLTSEIARRLREVGLIADNVDPSGALRGLALDDKGADSKTRLVRADAAAIYGTATAQARATLGSLRDALDSLSVAQGHKTVLFISEGFFRDPTEPLYTAVAEAARRANAAVDFLDARELKGLPDNTSVEMERVTDPRDHAVYERDLHDAEGTESVAVETGGSIFHGRLEMGLDRAAGESGSYYLIGYEPAWIRADGRFHKIKVQVARPGVEVRARRGYQATAPTPAAGGLHPDVRHALDSPLEASGIPLSLASYVLGPTESGRSLVVLAGTVDGGQLAWADQGGRFADGIETTFRLTPARGGEPIDRDRRLDLRLTAAERAAVLGTGVPLLGDFDLAPGRYLARLVVRDEGSGHLGSVFHDLEVPGPGFRLSTPILTDTIRTSAGGPPTPIPLARRTFDAGKRLYCSFQVLDAASPPGGAPRVTFEVAVFRADGTALARRPSQQLVPGPHGELQSLVAVSLDQAAPGEYQVALQAHDQTTGRTADVRERFTVVGPAAATAAVPDYRALVEDYRRGETTRALAGLRALGPGRGREEAHRLGRDTTCDARCLEAAALMHTDLAVAAGDPAEVDVHLAVARDLLERLPGGPDGRSWRRDWLLAAGDFLERETRFPEALKLFDEAARLTPDDAEVLLARGTVAEVLSLLPDLVPRSHEPSPAGSSLLGELVDRSDRQRGEARALALYQQALARDPGLLEARLRCGRIEGRQGQAQAAAADLEAVTSDAAEPYLRSLASLFLGELEERAGHLQGAIERYRAAVDARPGFQTARVALSEALQRLGHLGDSRHVIESGLTAVDAEPEDPWIGYHLGLAWRYPVALERLRRSLQP